METKDINDSLGTKFIKDPLSYLHVLHFNSFGEGQGKHCSPDAFLDEIMTAGGPMEQALNYLNVEKLLPVQKV